MSKNDILHVAGSMWLAMACGGIAFAQTGQIAGRVADASGAVVSGAEVKVRNSGTNQERTTQTNQDGLYTVPLLGPGRYDVTAARTGFKFVTRMGVNVAVDQRLEVNFVLEVGAVTERVEVVGQALQINTLEASQGQVIDNKRIVEMPLNGRYYGDLGLVRK